MNKKEITKEYILMILKDIEGYIPRKIREDNFEGLKFNMSKLLWVIEQWKKEVKEK